MEQPPRFDDDDFIRWMQLMMQEIRMKVYPASKKEDFFAGCLWMLETIAKAYQNFRKP